MRRWLAALFCSIPVFVAGQSTPVTVVTAARMIDAASGAAIANPVVVIQDGRIIAAGAGVAVPAGARVIDLGSATLLPGLIDAHTHLLQNYSNAFPGGDDDNMVLTVAQLGNTRRALLGVKMGREALMSGITTVRDLGNSGVNGDVALRDAINDGWVVGPRMVVSTRALAAAGGQFGRLAPEVQKLVDQEYVVISGVEEARRAVRQALYDGADCIKVIVNTGLRLVSLDELRVIVEEAHRVNKKVAAHASTDDATRIAADAGVDSIEHGYTLPDDVIEKMAAKHIFLVPTDSIADTYIDLSTDPKKQQATRALLDPFIKASRDRLARAVKKGVPIAAGSDMYYALTGKTRGEASLLNLRAYAEAGMTPAQILRAATVDAAALLGWTDRVGVIKAGAYADLIAVDGDPLTAPRVLEHVRFVMKNGDVIRP